MTAKSIHKALFKNVKSLIEDARKHIVRNVNTTMLITYHKIGRLIIEEEQRGRHRAEYAKKILIQLSANLTREFGRGYSVDNLEKIRKFYLIYGTRISESLIRKSTLKSGASKSESLIRISSLNTFPLDLSWTHYFHLLKIENDSERRFYEIEAKQNNWSIAEMLRQIHSSLYERLALSRNKRGVKQLAQKGQMIEKPADALKNSFILEFLDLKEDNRYTENDFETAIISKLEHFMLELGKGFLFEGRQKRFTFDGDSFFVDLVFYNRLLKCFVLFDLKIGKLSHQDIGQMQMYVNYYDRMIKTKEENSTIGIILCKEANKAIIEFTLPKDKKQIFTKEYKLYLPSKEDLKKQIQ